MLCCASLGHEGEEVSGGDGEERRGECWDGIVVWLLRRVRESAVCMIERLVEENVEKTIDDKVMM